MNPEGSSTHSQGAHYTDTTGATRSLTPPAAARAHRFVAEVVAPQLGSAAVYYQVKPSLRVQAPGAHGIKFHTDREYHHQVRQPVAGTVRRL
jgi:hypothetical protein